MKSHDRKVAGDRLSYLSSMSFSVTRPKELCRCLLEASKREIVLQDGAESGL